MLKMCRPNLMSQESYKLCLTNLHLFLNFLRIIGMWNLYCMYMYFTCTLFTEYLSKIKKILNTIYNVLIRYELNYDAFKSCEIYKLCSLQHISSHTLNSPMFCKHNIQHIKLVPTTVTKLIIVTNKLCWCSQYCNRSLLPFY